MLLYQIVLYLATIFLSVRLGLIFLKAGVKTGNRSVTLIGYTFFGVTSVFIVDYPLDKVLKGDIFKFLGELDLPILMVMLIFLTLSFSLRTQVKSKMRIDKDKKAA